MTQEPGEPGEPSLIGPYRIVRKVGEGGQGVVYLGTAPDGRPVAVKVLREDVAGDDRFAKEFAKEIAAARRVEPFCIAQVLDASLGGRPYIVTEYVEGPSLQQAGRHTGADLQRLAVATATALAAIHRAGVVHRDFKPANVLLGRDGPRVIDFGIARTIDAALTVTSSIVGTPAYMAPEQIAGQHVGPAADVFAWASVIVSAATGTPPFGNDSMPAVLRRVLHDEPQLGDLPQPLRSIVYNCLAKDPALRPAMQDVLFQLIGGHAPPPSPPRRHAPPPLAPRRHAPPASPPRRTATPRSRRGAVLLVTGGAVVAAAVVWLPSTFQPGITGRPAALPSSGPTPITTDEPITTKTKVKQSGKPTRTPSRPARGRDETGARPTRSPGATSAPSPSAKPTSAPNAKAAPSPSAKRATAGGGVGSVSVRPEGVKLGDCWRQDVILYGIVGRTGARTEFTYRWLVDGQDLGRTVSTTPAKTVLPAGSLKTSGPHRVVFRVITPVSIQRTLTVNLCDFDKF
ncbi:protein kinase [Sphaerisporangium sp. NBC_01403]|uniref:serine/threonine protein kinase n=1 Tax=Sphaerisporangium sp. NBC_01403 TaxID=2903599 RepID=UPI0032551277